MSKAIETISAEAYKILRKAENDWLERIFEAYLPDEIFAKTKGNEQDKLAVVAYLESEGYYVTELPDGEKQVRKGEEILARARFNIQYLS